MASSVPKPVVKVPVGVLFSILVLLLLPAILLLIYARTREQILGAFLLLALVAAIVTFGFLGASGVIKTRQRQIGGSAAGLVAVLGMLLPFARDPTGDVSGIIYVDGIPPKQATVYLLETELRDNRKDLEERDQGLFEFKDVRGLGPEVRLRVRVQGREKVVRATYREGKILRIELLTKDFQQQEPQEPSPLSSCLEGQDPESQVVYLLDLQAQGMDSARLNGFLNVLAYKLDNGIRNHLLSRELMGSKSLRVQRCNKVQVDIERDAIRIGTELHAPAVLWGFAEQKTDHLQSVMSLTALLGRPFSVISGLTYADDISELARPERPVEDIYLAFSAFLLGREYLRRGEPILARRCFLHAQELSPRGTPLRDEVENALRESEAMNPARILAPVG